MIELILFHYQFLEFIYTGKVQTKKKTQTEKKNPEQINDYINESTLLKFYFIFDAIFRLGVTEIIWQSGSSVNNKQR